MMIKFGRIFPERAGDLFSRLRFARERAQQALAQRSRQRLELAKLAQDVRFGDFLFSCHGDYDSNRIRFIG
jgi:hypothetical protein